MGGVSNGAMGVGEAVVDGDDRDRRERLGRPRRRTGRAIGMKARAETALPRRHTHTHKLLNKRSDLNIVPAGRGWPTFGRNRKYDVNIGTIWAENTKVGRNGSSKLSQAGTA